MSGDDHTEPKEQQRGQASSNGHKPETPEGVKNYIVGKEEQEKTPWWVIDPLHPDRAPKFAPPIAAARLQQNTPIGQFGGQLYNYRDGCYRSGGRNVLIQRLQALLENSWKDSHQREVLSYLMGCAPTLDEQPPADTINLTNGLLDVPTGELREHTSSLLTSVQLPVAYKPDATCPLIARFLDQALPDPHAQAQLLEMIGLVLVPDMSYQKALMLLGPGGNGKSVLLTVIANLVGRGNMSTRSLHALEDKFAVANLYGKLVNICGDLDRRAVTGDSVFKELTGGETMTGENKFQDAFTFQPFCRLIFSANEAPPTTAPGEAFFRRWLILPFDHKPARPDPHLPRKLSTPAELSGLLNLALAGYRRLQARGAFTESDTTREAMAQFRRDVDPVEGFVADCCEEAPGKRCSRTGIYEAYQDWCKESGRAPLSRQRLYSRLRDRGHVEKTVEGQRFWQGIRYQGSLVASEW